MHWLAANTYGLYLMDILIAREKEVNKEGD